MIVAAIVAWIGFNCWLIGMVRMSAMSDPGGPSVEPVGDPEIPSMVGVSAPDLVR